MKKLTRLALAFALLAASIPARADDSPAPFSVERRGTGEPALLFIPGLTCSGRVWNEVVDHFSKTNECHVFTLAGMGGQPPVEGPWFATMRDAILEYARSNNLRKPVIVGHSIGGSLAFALGVAANEGELGGVVAVDGLPRLAELMMPGAPPERIDAIASMMKTQIASAGPDAFRQQNEASLGAMVTNADDRAMVLEDSNRSDPATVGLAMSELLMADLRDDLANMDAPALLIAAAGYAKDEASRRGVMERYRAQVAKAQDCETRLAENALHFVFLDDPTFFRELLEDFLANRAAKPGDQEAAEAP